MRADAGRRAYPGLRSAIVPSDRGSQYTGGTYRTAVEKYGRRHGNARCESMWAGMKTELLYDRLDPERLTVEERKSLIWRYFMSYWNRRRISSASDGLPPAVKRLRCYLSPDAAAYS